MVLICGIPNAGKTTLSSQYDNVIHADDFHCREETRMQKITEILHESNGDLCVDGVFRSRAQRMALLRSVCDKDVVNTCIWIDTPIDVCLERENNYRKRPPHIVCNNAKYFEPPTLDEGWDEIQIIRWQPDNEPTVTVLCGEQKNIQSGVVS